MTLCQFKMLSKDDQYRTVFTKGQFVEAVTEGETQYVLYAVSMFWVAVTSNAASNKILKCAPFVHGNSLDNYNNIPKRL